MTAQIGRQVRDVVDGAGLYFSRLVTAGPYVFLGGVASDGESNVAHEARPERPYAFSPAANVVSQTRYIFERYRELLTSVDSSLDDVVQVEQWIPHKYYADGYIETSRGPGFLERQRPASALLWTGELIPAGSTITPMGIAVMRGSGRGKEVHPPSPRFHERMRKKSFGETFQSEGPFNEVVTAGEFVFIVGDIAQDWESGDVEEGVRLSDSTWWGSAIRNESEFLLTRLEQYLARVGASLADVIHSSVYLNDIGDMFELDRIWKRRFPVGRPARSVIPVSGLGVPRREATHLQHQDGAVQMEHLTVALRPGLGIQREVVSTGRDGVLAESEAIRTGNLLWISGQMADLGDSPDTDWSIERQLDAIFGHLEVICNAGGTALTNLVRLRGFVTDPQDAYAIYSKLRRVVPSEPPTVGITTVPSPLPFPNCTVMLDGIAFVPRD